MKFMCLPKIFHDLENFMKYRKAKNKGYDGDFRSKIYWYYPISFIFRNFS